MTASAVSVRPVHLLRLLLIGVLLSPQIVLAARGPRGVRKATRSIPQRHLDDSEDEKKKKKKGPSSRDCSVKEDSGKVEFKCKAKTDDGVNEIKDEIKYKVETKGSEPLTVKVEYENEIEDVNGTETETETKFEVEFLRVVEYRKSDTVTASVTDDAAMAFDWENDAVVNTYELSAWNEFTPVTDSDNLSTFSVTDTNSIAMFQFTVARTDTPDVTANKMKIDFDFSGYVWDSDDTYVALICAVKSERKIEVDYEDDADGPRKTKDVVISFDDAIDTIGFTPFGEYTWAEVAQAIDTNATNVTAADDGETISVVATSPDDATSNEIAFSFVGSAAMGASDIYWDPEAGIGYAEAEAVDSGVAPGSGAVGIIASIATFLSMLAALAM